MITGLKNKVKKRLLKYLPGHKPDFIIIGAQKAGTSSLHYYLSQHPNLSGSYPKEIHYFDIWINHGRTITWYENHFKSLSWRKQLYFEASPSYIFLEPVARQLKAYQPNIKLILVLRNPVDRAYSAWKMLRDYHAGKPTKKLFPSEGKSKFINDKGEFLPFMDCIRMEMESLGKDEDQGPNLIRKGFYARQIEQYWQYFDKKQILILGFKDLVSQTERTLNEVCDFLDVPTINYVSMDKEPRNVRANRAVMTKPDYAILETIFAAENEKLFQLLGKPLNW